MSADRDAAIEVVIRYHDRTKHDVNRSARAPGYLDWANQPDPFRRYHGAPQFLLPFADDPATRYEELHDSGAPARPLSLQSISWLLECSFGVSATKSASGTSWKLRCNPSSGNLHPTEGYLLLSALEGLHEAPAVYHYRSDDHALEQRCAFSTDQWKELSTDFPRDTFFIGLSSIHWREAWKYGERAFRYCNHDLGHALAALRFAAAALGWQCALLDAVGTADIQSLLGLDRTNDFVSDEPEQADALLAVWPNGTTESIPDSVNSSAIPAISRQDWNGAANKLSEEIVDWPIIGETAAACLKPKTESGTHGRDALPRDRDATPKRTTEISAGRIFRQRRSAVDMDAISTLSRDDFYLTLERAMPGANRAPFDLWPYAPEVHLGLFVHRVTGLTPGLYFLVRDASQLDALRRAMRTEFTWQTPPACPATLPLFQLASGDCRGFAAQLSCMQNIAGEGAFSLGMIARFDGPLRERGPWFYPRLFWEAGMIGQVLYLEAEASGLRGTGIGCYFDDPVHRVFGLSDHAYQSLYHFTVGGPVDDPRLTTLPPYSAERRAQSGWV